MELVSSYIVFAALGGIAGIIAGLLGVGGGLLIVPVLVAIFSAQGISAEIYLQLAIGTSLATIMFTSLSSAYAHHRRHSVHWASVGQLSIGMVIGGGLGGLIADWIGGVILTLLFGVFEIFVAAQMIFSRPPKSHAKLPSRLANASAGIAIGGFSALLGIGGGTLSVPWLVWHSMPIHIAIGSSAACGITIAAVGALGFVVVGWHHPDLPNASTGYVYWPAVLLISLTSTLSAPWGAKLAHHLNPQQLKKLFALILAGLGLWMLLRGLT